MNKLEEYLVDWDPIGLVVAGAPSDEYNLEAFEIIRAFDHDMTTLQVAKLVHVTFIRLTEVDYPGFEQECIERADEIKKILHDNLENNGNQANRAEIVSDQGALESLKIVSERFNIHDNVTIAKIAAGQKVSAGELMDLKLVLSRLRIEGHSVDANLDKAMERVSKIVFSEF